MHFCVFRSRLRWGDGEDGGGVFEGGVLRDGAEGSNKQKLRGSGNAALLTWREVCRW